MFLVSVANQAPPLVGHDVVASDTALVEAVTRHASAEVVEDDALARELWSPGIEAWFPQGPDDDSIVMIKVNGETAEYWDTPGGRVASVLSLVKSKATGERYDGGENETVDLHPAG